MGATVAHQPAAVTSAIIRSGLKRQTLIGQWWQGTADLLGHSTNYPFDLIGLSRDRELGTRPLADAGMCPPGTGC